MRIVYRLFFLFIAIIVLGGCGNEGSGKSAATPAATAPRPAAPVNRPAAAPATASVAAPNSRPPALTADSVAVSVTRAPHPERPAMQPVAKTPEKPQARYLTEPELSEVMAAGKKDLTPPQPQISRARLQLEASESLPELKTDDFSSLSASYDEFLHPSQKAANSRPAVKRNIPVAANTRPPIDLDGPELGDLDIGNPYFSRYSPAAAVPAPQTPAPKRTRKAALRSIDDGPEIG